MLFIGGFAPVICCDAIKLRGFNIDVAVGPFGNVFRAIGITIFPGILPKSRTVMLPRRSSSLMAAFCFLAAFIRADDEL